ncbi:MAG TPA: D-alanine--D-alanine ligase family protein [Actinomycetota bacterium]|nr:D-alanine--D-alanine ligase family protein [Actinomycetota bacterium]
MAERLTIGVVFGGRSVEHDVSIVTAHQVMAVARERYDVVPVYVARDGRWFSSPALDDLEVYKKGRHEEVGDEVVLALDGGGLQAPGGRLKGPRRIPLDVVVPAIHGTFGEDGTLQGLLEMAGIPYAGSGVLASAVGMNKVEMKTVFRAAGLPVVPHEVVAIPELDANPDAVLDRIERSIGYPAFVKPSRLGSSVGIGRAPDRAALTEALDVARRYDDRVLVEKAMEGCIEVNCSVLGGAGLPPRASVCEQPLSWREFLSFEDKYMRGGKSGGGAKEPGGMAAQDRRIPAPIADELTKQVQDNALAAFAAVGASGVARIDSFVDEETGDTWVMEINTVPGSFAFYLWEASGLSFADLVRSLVDSALRAHEEKGKLMFSFDSGLLAGFGGGKTRG